MTDEQFRGLCNVYGFAPSRSLRELLDTATAQAVLAEREACAKLCETYEVASIANDAHNFAKVFNHCTAAIRARKENT